MPHQFSPTVERLIRARMESGKYATEDELMLEALQSLEEDDRELQAIQEALDSLDRGEMGTELDDAFLKIREKYNVET